jgi:CCR4-NOT transcriptional regulation complex NOT5 subunit
MDQIPDDAGNSLTPTNATKTFQEVSSSTATADAFHDTMMTDPNDNDEDNNHNMLAPTPHTTLPKKKTAESSPELEAMIGGLRQELDAVIQVNKVETDRMFDEMVVFLEDSHAICTETMLGHLDFEQSEANRLTGMEPDVDAATVSLVGNHFDGHDHHM